MSDFEYDKMTPELQEYLNTDWRNKYEERQVRYKLLEEQIKAYSDAHKVWFCRDATALPDFTHEFSPSGRYRITVTTHNTGPKTWSYTKARIHDVQQGHKLVATVCRNYGQFPFLFVEGHAKSDFLICGEDYQSSTVVNLRTGEISTRHTSQFCWAKHIISPSKNTLVVEGCYWAAPYELKVYDFSDPMGELKNYPIEGYPDAFGEWTGPDSFTYGGSYRWSKKYQKPYHKLTEEEENDALDIDDDEEERFDLKGEWKRP